MWYMMNESNVFVNTQIGNFITIEKSGVTLPDAELLIGDIVDQFSPVDDNGCFIVRVHHTLNQNNVGKVWTVCESELY